MGLGALAVGYLPLPVLAAPVKRMDSQRRLALFNTHTYESIDICYFDQGTYCKEAVADINYILRDHRCGKVHPIDLRLLDQLYAIKLKLKPQTAFHIISGYRSPATNVMLRKRTKGVARTSYHTKGQAIDIRLPGQHTDGLRDICIAMKSGGVGHYPDSNFVHLDTGPVRHW